MMIPIHGLMMLSPLQWPAIVHQLYSSLARTRLVIIPRSFLTLLDHLRARHAGKARDFYFLEAKESPLLVGLEVFHMGMA
jgi:hypothetical protein